ncbi:hypothetical protein AVEN_41386-1 [Araneus ventricosus]|uniref:Uncharacterized protein n=1 Tax=Araneus ventricosus TaxID=182803 RepID=A0A4Y2SKH7_ARAVE|nr:hypothetical protein AVEN_41386-1 [Araneus ventricosus]
MVLICNPKGASCRRELEQDTLLKRPDPVGMKLQQRMFMKILRDCKDGDGLPDPDCDCGFRVFCSHKSRLHKRRHHFVHSPSLADTAFFSSSS